MSDIQIRLEQAVAHTDLLARAHGIEELCYEAEHLLASGDKTPALAVLKSIYALGPDDDLLYFSYTTARRALIDEGILLLPPVQQLLDQLERQHAHLDPRDRLMTMARALHRQYQSDYPEASAEIRRLLDSASQLSALSASETKFRRAALKEA